MAPSDWIVVSNEAEALKPSKFKSTLEDAAKSLNFEQSFKNLTAYEFYQS